MSIKTIDTQIKGSAGVAKKINKGAEKMVFDILQSTQYSTPIPSTVRELATNACDAQREKEMAIEILTGKVKAEDYYITRGGEQYSDSNFDPTYYDLKHLNTADNGIKIIYEKHEGVGYCDVYRVIDNGVGIGERRLEGVLELGYSTKRNTSENFGAFGLGAKVALSTGVDFYTIETVHNGKKFKCNCYNYKTDFIVPSFNVKTGQANPHILLSDGTKVFYETTTELNRTEISFGVKRHHRRDYENAVEEQLMYINNISFEIHDNDSNRNSDGTPWVKEMSFKPEVLHTSENLIISDTYVFRKPHIVMVKNGTDDTGINYGFVDFRELEMEQMWGPVAFKCPARQVIVDPDTGKETVLQEGVDVTPSREKVIWNEATKNYIQHVIIAAAEEATEIIQTELLEKDFIAWISACKSVLNKGDDGTVVGRLSGIVDKEALKPVFAGDKRLRYESPKLMLRGITAKVISKDFTSINSTSREDMANWDLFSTSTVFLKGEDSFNKTKDAWLHEQVGNFVVLDNTSGDALPDNITGMPAGEAKTKAIVSYKKLVAKKKRVWELLVESEHIQMYSEVEVPEEWIEEHKEKIEQAEELAKHTDLTPAERRKIEERMVAYTLRKNHKHFGYSDRERFTWDKIEPRAKDLMKMEGTIYYGTMEDSEKLKFAAGILQCYAPIHKRVYTNSPYGNWNEETQEPVFFYKELPVRFSQGYNKSRFTEEHVNTDFETPQLLRVSQTYVKHIKKNPNVKHIDEFFLQLTPNGGYTMDKHAIEWFTARKVKGMMGQTHLSCLKDINPDLFEKYKILYNTAEKIYSFTPRYLEESPLFDQMQKIITFQQYALEVDDPALLAEKSRELFVIDVPEAVGENLEILEMFEELTAFNDGVKTLLSQIPEICYSPENMGTVPDELQKEIEIYLDAKDRLQWQY